MAQGGFRPEDACKSEEEIALEKRARELEKQKRKLEEEVGRAVKPEKTASGLGADLQPVPEPTVRDLSVPQAKGPRVRKTTYPDAPKEPAPRRGGRSIPAREIRAGHHGRNSGPQIRSQTGRAKAGGSGQAGSGHAGKDEGRRRPERAQARRAEA